MTDPDVTYQECCSDCQTRALERKERVLAARGVSLVIENGAASVAEYSPLIVLEAAGEMQKALLDIAELNMGITA
jgi:hypothetical protein